MDIAWIIGIIGGVASWLYNELQKRKMKLILDKEKRYETLIKYIRCFGDKSENIENANHFIVELQLCWMYCPDEVILKGNAFLNAIMMKQEQHQIDFIKGEFVLALRQDLIRMNRCYIMYLLQSKTQLRPIDFKDFVY